MTTIEPFQINISDQQLQDLQHRLEQFRPQQDFGNDQWQYGVNGDYLKELVEYWRDSYDWRVQEQAMNQWPHFRTVIDDVPIHFMHILGKGPNPTPLIMSHGWPWSFWDFHKVIGPLTDPASHGGDPEISFDLVIPSLPGFGFSTPLRKTGQNFWTTADLWVKLMDNLGYSRFAAHGGDWGAFITQQLGHKYADRLIGIHTSLITPLDFSTGGTVPKDSLSDEELKQVEKNNAFLATGISHFALHVHSPQTISYALNDSPVGLLAWLVEKRRAWSDCNGDVETRFSKDELINLAMIYWLTGSIGTSVRYYHEAVFNPWQPSHNRKPVVEAPTGVTLFAKELILQPRSWAETYFNLKRWTPYAKGGHFAPAEEPTQIIEDLRAFFSGLKENQG